MDLLRILLAILLPPLGVFFQVGIGPHFWINILLDTLVGGIPVLGDVFDFAFKSNERNLRLWMGKDLSHTCHSFPLARERGRT